jgi:hypothetical protein
LNAVLPTSELAQLSEAGKVFALEGHAARTTAEQDNGKEVKASLGSEQSTVTENGQGAESKVGTVERTWLTSESSLREVGFR